VDAKLTKRLGVQWVGRDVMMSPFCKELMGEMEEYKGPFGRLENWFGRARDASVGIT
jgi:hypothetical protein